MLSTLVWLGVGLVIILLASELFTNALEHLGARLHLSEGVTGSVFAAIGTALPETIVPLLALVAGTASAAINQEIGVGAILGAPLMLSTLTFFLLGIGVVGQRGVRGTLEPEIEGVHRDLNFFLFGFALAAAAMWAPLEPRSLRIAISAALLLTYVLYVRATVLASRHLVKAGHATAAGEPLVLARIGLGGGRVTIVTQLALALLAIIGGAKLFIVAVEDAAHVFGMSTLLLSLLIIPVATELPEKINSITWARRGKDTLGVGNITGAMVFQGTLLPALGILLTPWTARHEVLLGVALTALAAAWLRVQLRAGRLSIWALGVNGGLYAIYLALTLLHGAH
jgi:cation:H+ antiporter